MKPFIEKHKKWVEAANFLGCALLFLFGKGGELIVLMRLDHIIKLFVVLLQLFVLL